MGGACSPHALKVGGPWGEPAPPMPCPVWRCSSDWEAGMFSIDSSNPAARAAMMLRPLLGGWCALVLLALCGCAASTVTVCCTGGPTSGNTGGGDTSGGATVVSRGLSLITEPGPGDRPFVALIDGARDSVEVTKYELNDPQ